MTAESIGSWDERVTTEPADLVFWYVSRVESGLVDSEDCPPFRIGWISAKDFTDDRGKDEIFSTVFLRVFLRNSAV